jgi:hypothetical protein
MFEGHFADAESAIAPSEAQEAAAASEAPEAPLLLVYAPLAAAHCKPRGIV